MHRPNGSACVWPPCLICSLLYLPVRHPVAPPLTIACWASRTLLPQPVGQIVLLLGNWVKLIRSRRCVLSAGDPGHRFYIICTGLLTSSPPFMAFSLQEGHSVQNEASCSFSHYCSLGSYLRIVGDNFFLCFVGLCKVALAVGYRHSVLHKLFFVGGGQSLISSPIQGNEPL